MAWMLSGEAVLANMETRMVFDGWITYWTNNHSKSMMIFKNPLTGNEDRMTLTAPGPWWVIQHQMQMMEELFGGTPMLEIEHTPAKTGGVCDKCDGLGGNSDDDGNWVDCPGCKGQV